MRNKRPVDRKKGKINFHTKGKLTTKAEVAAKVNTEEIVGMRLNKYIAHCGIGSRREATTLVNEGKIKVNGAVKTEAHYQIEKGDKIEFEGKKIEPKGELVYLLLNKPKNTSTIPSEESGRTTVADIIGKAASETILPIDHLESETLGLLVLTNDDQLLKKLSAPTKKVKQLYHVSLNKGLLKKHFEQISESLKSEEATPIFQKIEYIEDASPKEIQVTVQREKEDAIKQVFEDFGYEVKKLDRVYYSGLTKKDLPRGQFRFLSEREVIMLKHFS